LCLVCFFVAMAGSYFPWWLKAPASTPRRCYCSPRRWRIIQMLDQLVKLGELQGFDDAGVGAEAMGLVEVRGSLVPLRTTTGRLARSGRERTIAKPRNRTSAGGSNPAARGRAGDGARGRHNALATGNPRHARRPDNLNRVGNAHFLKATCTRLASSLQSSTSNITFSFITS